MNVAKWRKGKLQQSKLTEVMCYMLIMQLQPTFKIEFAKNWMLSCIVFVCRKIVKEMIDGFLQILHRINEMQVSYRLRVFW